MKRFAAFSTVACLSLLLVRLAAAMPMRPMPTVAVSGTVVEAKWTPEETRKGLPGASGSMGHDRTIPAHFEVRLKDADVQIVQSTGNKDFDGPTGKQAAYHLRINSGDKGFLKPGMKIKVPDYRLGGDEGGVRSQHGKVEILSRPDPEPQK